MINIPPRWHVGKPVLGPNNTTIYLTKQYLEILGVLC